MLTAGVSLLRVLLPLIVLGLLTFVATMALNYELAPHAELARRHFFSDTHGQPAALIEGQIFRNRTDARTWFIQNFRLRSNEFNTVQVLQQDEHDTIVTNYLGLFTYHNDNSRTGLNSNEIVAHPCHLCTPYLRKTMELYRFR